MLSAKDNQPTFKQNIEDFVQDSDLRKSMATACSKEKNRGRIEKRTAFVSRDITWLKKTMIGKNTLVLERFTANLSQKGKSDQWHYYISSKLLTPDELLKHAGGEWNVETMRWLLDVHFKEDECQVQEESVQKGLNMLRKVVTNHLTRYREATGTKSAFTHIMMDCLIDLGHIGEICEAVKGTSGEN